MRNLFIKVFNYRKFPDHNPEVLKHNLTMHLTDGILFFLGASLVSAQTVVPVFLQMTGATPMDIAAVQALGIIGLNLPQLLLIGRGFNPPRLLPLILKYSFIFRFMFFVIGVFAFFIPFVSRQIAVLSLMFLMISSAFLGSLAGPMWFHLLFLTTPVKLRGRLMGIRQFVGSLLGILGGFAVKIIIDSVAYPYSFGFIFILSFLFLFISWFFVKRLIEPEREIAPLSDKQGEIFPRMKSILKRDKRFLNYIIADFLTLMSFTSTSFFAIYGIGKFNLSPGVAGLFTMIMMATMAVSNILFGITADRKGHKLNLQFLLVSGALSCITAIFAQNSFMYGMVFVFAAVLLAIQGISRIAFVAEICEERDRIAYIGLLNFITAPALLFGLLSGYLIKFLGYELIFAADAALSVIAFLILTLKVSNPRIIKNF